MFTSVPEDYHFCARDTNDLGTLIISGKFTSTEYNRIRTEVLNENGFVLEEHNFTADTSGKFHIEHTLQKGLQEYTLKIFCGNIMEEFLYKKTTNIVCGDVFLVSGQSNAVAGLDPPDAISLASENFNRFCRGLGFGGDYGVTAPVPMNLEYKFSIPTCIPWEVGYTGAWPLKLANYVSMSTGVAVCIVNNAQSGSYISLNLPTITPSITDSLNDSIPYDRGYKKLQKFGLEKFVKGVFWYQGEADAAFSYEEVLAYTGRFSTLRRAWKNDYPNLKKIFVLQITPGCGGIYNGLIAELQRKLSTIYPDVVLMSTVGTHVSERNVDGCHYTKAGLSKIADKLIPVTLKELYNFNYGTDTVYPPMIKRAFTSNHDQICLEFDKKITFHEFTVYLSDTAFLKDHLFGSNYTQLNIQSLAMDENKLYLNFPEKVTLPTTISYVPNNYSKVNTVYCGPWIMNKNGTLGALSFREFPIESNTAELQNNSSDQNLIVFPVPSKDYFKLIVNSKTIGANKVMLYDNRGDLIQESIFEKNEFTLHLKPLSPGIYMIKVAHANGLSVKKVIVE